MTAESWYNVRRLNNGYTMECSVCGENIFTDVESVVDHITTEEKKFPNDE